MSPTLSLLRFVVVVVIIVVVVVVVVVETYYLAHIEPANVKVFKSRSFGSSILFSLF